MGWDGVVRYIFTPVIVCIRVCVCFVRVHSVDDCVCVHVHVHACVHGSWCGPSEAYVMHMLSV